MKLANMIISARYSTQELLFDQPSYMYQFTMLQVIHDYNAQVRMYDYLGYYSTNLGKI